MLPLWVVKLMVASGLERLVSSFFFSKVRIMPRVVESSSVGGKI